MSRPEPSFSVQVDFRNPGQFFACCGLLELAHRTWPSTEAWFEDGSFLVAPPTNSGALADLLLPVVQCEVTAAPGLDDKTAPIELGSPRMRLEWWLRDDGKPNLFKTWAANATSCQMFMKWQGPLESLLEEVAREPGRLFSATTRIQGSYGFDSDLEWDALSVGFSLNEHAGLKELPSHPAVELLGAVGLQRFFPNFDPKDQLIEYATWGIPLPATVARVAMLGLVPSVATGRLRTRFVYRGSFKGLTRASTIQRSLLKG